MNEQVSKPLVSIIVPIYNIEQYLVECLDSLVGQTYDNVEILAIDDGSTDSSYAVLKEYAAQHRQVRAFHQENAGAAVARNWGVDEAKGKYVCFVDPDDALELDTVEEMVKVAEELQTDVVMTCLARYDSELKELLKVDLHFPQVEKLPPVFSGEDIATKIYATFRNGPSPCNKFIRRQFIVEHGLKFQALPRVNDLCFAYATLAFARRIHVINKAYYKYRTSRKGSSQNSTDKDPTPVCSAYHRLKEVLSEAGKFDVFAKSFYMAFYGSCSYTFRQLKNISVAERLLKLLRSESMADITGARLTRDDFRTDAQFAAYQSFWRQRDAVQLMLDDETKKRLAADAAPRVAGGPSKTLGFICGSLRPGGIERVIVRLIPLFVAKGYKVILMTGAPVSPDEYPLPEGCERVIVGRYGARGVDRLQRIKLTMLRYGIDTVIDHEYYQLEIEREIDAIHALGARVIVHHHSVFSNMYLRNDRQFALPELLKGYRKADAIITLSDIDEKFFRIMGCAARRITDPLPDIPPVSHEGPRGHVILWVARFVSGKRPLDAVRIAEKVLESIPDARLIMLGDGEARQVAAVREYLSARPKLAAAVSLEGYCSDVIAYAKKADVFLTTTKFDGFSLSILEAKAAALPVVSYAMPYLESIRPGTGALTVPQGDIEAAAEAIVGLFGDSDGWEKLSRQARVSYEHFSNYDQWAQYESLFASLGSDRARPDMTCDCESMRVILETLLEHVGISFQMLKQSGGFHANKIFPIQKPLHENRESGFIRDILRRTIQCYRDEGFAYTLKRLFKLGRK